jgi:hypothetical protein
LFVLFQHETYFNSSNLKDMLKVRDKTILLCFGREVLRTIRTIANTPDFEDLMLNHLQDLAKFD